MRLCHTKDFRMQNMLYGRMVMCLVFCSVIASAPCYAAEVQPIGNSIVWVKDFAAAVKQAKADGKMIMVDCWSEQCPWCEVLDRTTLADKNVVEASRRFVNVKVNGDKSREFMSRYRIAGYPTILFLDGDSRELYRAVGMQPSELFAPIMNDVAAGRNPDKVIAELIAHPPEDAPSLWRLVHHFLGQRDRTAVFALLEKLWRLPPEQVADRSIIAEMLGSLYLQSGRTAEFGRLLADVEKLTDKSMKPTALRLKLSQTIQVERDYTSALTIVDELIAMVQNEQERKQLQTLRDNLNQELLQSNHSDVQQP